MNLDFIDWIITGSMIIFIFSSNIIAYLLKNKVDKSLNNLIFIISIIPIIPLFWAIRQILIFNNKSDISFTFYTALILTIFILSILIRNIYLYIKKKI